MTKTVSIITPTYNSERFIRACIDSIRMQTWQDWQLLIVDDCSSDDTVKIIESYKRNDLRIFVLHNHRHLGPAGSRNLAIEQASGRFIAFLDSDDLWAPHKLETQVRFMEESGAALSYTGYEKMLENGTKMHRIVHVPATISYKGLLNHNFIGCLTAMYDTDQTGKVYMPEIKRRQDFGLWLRILKAGHTAKGIDESLAYLRLRKGSLSSNKAVAAWYTWQLYREVERLSFPRSMYHFANNVVRSYWKYRI